MINAKGQRNQKNGWQYDDGEGGYFKRNEQGTAYILGEGKHWSLDTRLAADEGKPYYTEHKTLKDAKATAEYLLS